MNLIDLIFPKSCLNCKKPGGYICGECISLVRYPKSTCHECNKPSIDGFTHIKCQRKYGINGLLSLWNYEGVLRKAIIALKFKYATEVARELTSYIVTELQSKKFLLPNGYCLVPVPLHWYRENNRGFNQSYLLGKKIAKEFKWNFIPDLLVRKKFGTPQVGLKGKDRTKNIKNVFGFNSSHRSLIAVHRSLILFDDVYTTGSTLKEAAKVLKRNGVEKVWGLTVAR